MSRIHGFADRKTDRKYVDWEDLRSFIFEHLGEKSENTDKVLRSIVKSVDEAVEEW